MAIYALLLSFKPHYILYVRNFTVLKDKNSKMLCTFCALQVSFDLSILHCRAQILKGWASNQEELIVY